MKTTRHSLMAKGILVLLSLLILIFVFTYSWFLPPDYEYTASGFSFTTSADMDFEYAIGFATSQTGNDYYVSEFKNGTIDLSAVKAVEDPEASTVTYKNDEFEYNVLYDYNPIDITGDGYTLIRPAMTYGNWNVNTDSNNYSIAGEGEQYIYFDMIFRSHSQCAIAIDEGSYARGACERTPGNGALNVGEANAASATEASSGLTKVETYAGKSAAEAYNKTTYGDFSKDAVVGALRVAFLEYEKKGDEPNLTGTDLLTKKMDGNLKTTPTLLWIPRPDIHIVEADNAGEWSLENVTTGDTFIHQYYDIFDLVASQSETEANGDPVLVPNKVVVTDNNAVASQITNNGVLFNQRKTIASVNVPGADSNLDGNPDYYYGKVRVRVWIEGTDSEARRAITGGSFRFLFDLTAVATV